MFIEPTINDALSHALRSQPPAIVRSVMDFGGSAPANLQEFVDLQDKRIAQAEEILNKWVAEGADLRTRLWKYLDAERDHVDAETLAILDRTIEAIEQKQAKVAKKARKDERDAVRMQKAAFRRSPAFGAAVRDILDRMLALEAHEYEQRADFLLFIRALKAEHDPAARGGVAFDDPEALERFLIGAT